MTALRRAVAAPSAGSASGRRAAVPWALLLSVGAALAAAGVAVAAIAPSLGPPLSYDAYATTLHFDRLVAGHRLEAPLGTTPKPLLTLAFGLAHALGGWGAVLGASIAAWSLSVGLATRLAVRVGGVGAGAAAAALLIASPTLLLETAWGLGTVWALGAWAAAGLAASANRPRWLASGFLLGLGALARPETLLVAAAAVAVGAARSAAGRPVPRQALAGAALALWCLPVIVLHDSALTGDPLYSVGVSSAYGAALSSVGALPGPGGAVSMVLSVLAGAPILAALAVVGAGILARRGAVPVLIGIAALGPGVAVALPVLAASGRLVDARYLEPIRCAMTVSAAVGIAGLLGWTGRTVERWRAAGRTVGRWRTPRSGVAGRGVAGRPLSALATVGAAAAVALGAAPGIGALDPATLATLARFRAFARSADVAAPVLAGVVAAEPAIASWPGARNLPGRNRPDAFAVPGNIRPRLALDLRIPLTRLVATDPLAIKVGSGEPPPGQVVLHSGGDLPADRYAVFEVARPGPVGSVLLVPLLSDPADATWIVRLDASGGSPLSAPTAR